MFARSLSQYAVILLFCCLSSSTVCRRRKCEQNVRKYGRKHVRNYRRNCGEKGNKNRSYGVGDNARYKKSNAKNIFKRETISPSKEQKNN